MNECMSAQVHECTSVLDRRHPVSAIFRVACWHMLTSVIPTMERSDMNTWL